MKRRKVRTSTQLNCWPVLLLAVLFLGLQSSAGGQARHEAVAPTRTEPPHFENTTPGVDYVGSETCAHCHSNIYKSFIKTDMGRSVSLPDTPTQLALASKPVTIRVAKLNRYFQVSRKGNNLDQSEYELSTDGKEIFRVTHKIDYVIGAGANGFTYVVKRRQYLFEAPLSYYSRSKSWGLSPGYEFGDYGFSRPIHAACITCHSGFPQPVPHRNGLFLDPPFREMAVGCENCHGPGALHVKSKLAGILPAGKVDPTIVNPANLTGWLADNICMKCHQGGDARVLQPGKQYADFRPGTPLNDTVAIFALPFTPQLAPESPLLQHYELMIMSKCYRASGGRLHCITCHDPHQQPSQASAPAYFRKKCLTCHTDKSCALPLKTRLEQRPGDNCIGCHMPKEKLKVISHAALTNHRIIAYEGEPLPEAAYHQTTPLLPDLIHLDAVPGSRSPLPPVVLLQAYGQLQGQHPQLRPQYLALLHQVEQSEAENPAVLSAAARQKLLEATPEGVDAARKKLARAIQLGSTEPSDYELYADTLAKGGNLEGAISFLQRGIALDPFYRRFYKDLALRYIAAKRYDEALQTIQHELELFPEDSFMRKILNLAEKSSAAP